ncbi:MAG: tetratricopeptide repeat protein, partial [Lentisphaeraceae bacterium]|nr:tetratricopeptide repeat protein [Lentisphaeraceae bacterium]
MKKLLILFLLLSSLTLLAQEVETKPSLDDLLAKGSYLEFFKQVEKLPQADKQKNKVRRLFIQAQLETGKYLQAAESLKKNPLLASDEDYYLSIRVLIHRGAIQDALKLNEAGLVKFPESHALFFAGMQLAELTGDINLENKTFAQVKKFFGKNGRNGTAKQKYYLARCATQRSAKMSYKLFQRAYKDNKQFTDAYIWAGFHCADKYAWRFATGEFSNALKVNPNHALAHAGMAHVLIEQNQYPKARGFIEKSLQINPACSKAIQLQSVILLIDDKKEEALTLLKKGLESNPNDLDILAHMAAVYEQMNNDSKRDEVIAQTLELNPKFSNVYVAIAQACENRRQFPQAVEWARKAITINNRGWEGHFIAAMNLLRLGEEKEGYEILERAARYNAFNVWAFNMLTLLDKDFRKKQFKLYETEHFAVKLHRSESEVLWPYIKIVVEEAYDKYVGKYNIAPKGPQEYNGKILLLMFDRHADFSARTVGLPGLGALGACFGQIITMPSPVIGKSDDARKFNWRRVFDHDFIHVLTLQASNYNVPRWFTEGISTWEEEDPQSEVDRQLKWAWENEKLYKLEDLNKGFTRQTYPNQIGVSYYHASIICRYLNDTYGFKSIEKILTCLRQDKKNVASLEEACGKSIVELNKEVKTYVDAFVRTIPLNTPVDPQTLAQLESNKEKLSVDDKLKLAAAYIHQNKAEDAKKIISETLSKNTNHIRANVMSGYIAYKIDKNNEDASKLLMKALSLKPSYFAANVYMAEISQEKKDVDQAIKYYCAAIDAYPRAAHNKQNLFFKLADLYNKKGDNQMALATLGKNCIINNKSYDSFVRYGKALDKAQQNSKAIQAYLDAIYIYPFDVDIHKSRAALFLKQKNYQEAASEFNVAIELEPRDKDALKSLLSCYVMLKDEVKIKR